MKRCCRCHIHKELTEFPKDVSRADGYSYACRSCRNIAACKYYRAHPEKDKARRLRRKNADYARWCEVERLRSRKWREANRERYLRNARACRKRRDKAKEKIYIEAWRKANAARRKQGDRDWQRRNRDKRNTQMQKRRAWKQASGGSHTTDQWKTLVAQYDHRCAYCKEQKPLTRDHIVALSRGGTNDISNILPACLSCNSSKGTKTLDEWRQVCKNLPLYAGSEGLGESI